MKKQLIVLLLAVVAVFLARPGWAQKGPIKVGFLTQMTGGGAAVGKDMSNGFTMYIEEISKQIAGRKFEVIIEDTQGDPAQALTKLRKLVESDNVHAVAGIFLANEGYALAPKVDEYRIPTVWAVSRPMTSHNAKPVKWAVRTGWTSSQPNHPFGEYVAKHLVTRRS
jgi:branched-chain amino acid transport system substrate-binding protein